MTIGQAWFKGTANNSLKSDTVSGLWPVTVPLSSNVSPNEIEVILKKCLVAFSIAVSGCTSISMMSNGISSNGKYTFANTNKAGENRLLIQFSKDTLLAKNMKSEDDTSISSGDFGVYSTNYYSVSSGKVSFRIKVNEPCQIALTNNKHPFFVSAHTDRENNQICSIRYMADLKTAKKV